MIGNYNQRSFRGTQAERLATSDLDFRFGDIYIEEDTGGTVYILSFDANAGGFFWLLVNPGGTIAGAPRYGIDGYMLNSFPAGPAFDVDMLRGELSLVTVRILTFPARISGISAVLDQSAGTDVTFTPEVDGVPIANSLTVANGSTGAYTVLTPPGDLLPEKTEISVRASSTGATTGFSAEVTIDLIPAPPPT